MATATDDWATSDVASEALRLIDSGETAAAREFLMVVVSRRHDRESHSKAVTSQLLSSAVHACIVGLPTFDFSSAIPYSSDWLLSFVDRYLNDAQFLKTANRDFLDASRVVNVATHCAHDGIAAPNCDEIDVDGLKVLLQAQRAQRSVSEKSLGRIVWVAKHAGLTQREIADLIDEPQTQVFRRLRALEEDPSKLAPGPREILERHKAGQFDRPRMIALLAAYPYASGEDAVEEPDWGYHPGSWDELVELTLLGEITRPEFDVISAASESIGTADE